MKKLSFIITGGNGYIGSHMCKWLHHHYEGKVELHIIDNHSTSPEIPVHSYGEFHKFNINNAKEVLSLFERCQPSAIFHFAANALVGESQDNPWKYYENNVLSTMTFLKTIEEYRIQKLSKTTTSGPIPFIFSSTCATFGNPIKDTIDETHPQNPVNTYGLSKYLIEQVLKDLAHKQLLNVAVLRYFNAAGCDPEGKLGENHDPETHLIPNLCLQELKGENFKFTIHGQNFSTPDGTCIRDYIHVNDLARAHHQAYSYISNPKNASSFEDFNLGTGKGHSVLDVKNIFEQVIGKKIPFTVGPPRPGDPPKLVSSSNKAIELLGFNPEFTLQDSIQQTMMFLKNKLK